MWRDGYEAGCHWIGEGEGDDGLRYYLYEEGACEECGWYHPDEVDCTPFPDALLKAMGTEFSYGLGLRNGWIVRFEKIAQVRADWILLTGIDSTKSNVPGAGDADDRGWWVRVSDIVWCAEAPEEP
jgi:hypothetical protein